MKATCPSCSTSYRVADEKVPDAGAQIKCPKCNTLFVVRRSLAPPPKAEPAPVVPHQQSTPIHALTGETPPPADPPKVPGTATSGVPAPPRQARGISAIRAQSGVKPQAAGLMDSFRVRTQKGLTYDFSTREAMVRWLRERDDLTGCEASEPGGDWHAAIEFIEAAPLGAEAAAKIAAATGAPLPAQQVPDVRPVKVAEPRPAYEPPSPAAGVLWWVAVGLTAVLVVLVAAATLTRYGIVDLSGYLPLEAVGIQAPGKFSGTDTPDVPGAGEPTDYEKVFHKAMSAARQAVRSKRFSKAALEYNRAFSIRPESVEALEGLARAYNGLGDRDRAKAVLEKVQSIKGE